MVNDIIRSIAVIPDQVKRNIYIKDCSRRLDIDELVVSRQVALQIKTIAENEYDRKQKERARQTIADIEQPQEPEVVNEEANNPVSYTHLDVYKRQRQAIIGVDEDEFDQKPRNSRCLLYTSRCV